MTEPPRLGCSRARQREVEEIAREIEAKGLDRFLGPWALRTLADAVEAGDLPQSMLLHLLVLDLIEMARGRKAGPTADRAREALGRARPNGGKAACP